MNICGYYEYMLSFLLIAKCKSLELFKTTIVIGIQERRVKMTKDAAMISIENELSHR